MSGPVLVARVDFGPGAGSGHLGRCLALAAQWRRAGGTAAIVSPQLRDPWTDRVAAAGVDWYPVGTVVPGADWHVADGYTITTEERRQLADGGRLLVIDDFAETAAHEGDLVLDQNAGARASDYPDRAALLGTRYVLVARPFADAAPRATAELVSRVVVGLGGFPSDTARAFVDRVLERWNPSADVVVLDGAQDVLDVLASSDLAIAAAGTFCWELCRMGVPMALLALNRNQQRLRDGIVHAGAAVDLGPLDPQDIERASAVVAALADDAHARRALAATATALVDGRGAARVVARLRSELLELRPVVPSDAQVLFDWANDPVTRAASFNSDPIQWTEHTAWLDARLGSASASQWIASWRDQLVGVVRFDDRGHETEIGITVVPSLRGQGWAAPLIVAGIARKRPAVAATVLARVKPDNVASIRAFEAADFDLRTPDDATVVEFVHRYRGG